MNMADRPKVTAVLPAYNAAPFIRPTLESLVAQTWENLEILIGDDASRDETAEILRAFARDHPRAKLVLREENLGWIGNANDLMRRATGSLIFMMPHDDELAPDYVEKLVDALAKNPRAVIAFSDYHWSLPDGGGATVTFDRLTGMRNPIRRAVTFALRPENWFAPYRGLFRAEAFQIIGGMKTTPGVGQYAAAFRWLYCMSLLGEWVRVPETLYRKNWVGRSLSNIWSSGPDAGRFLHRAAIEDTRSSRLPKLEKLAILAALHALAPLRAIRRRILNLRSA